MLRTQGPVRLSLEASVEMASVEEPGERIRLGKALQRLTLLLLDQHRADMARQELERLEISLVERLSVVAIGDAQDAARLVVDHDRNAHER